MDIIRTQGTKRFSREIGLLVGTRFNAQLEWHRGTFGDRLETIVAARDKLATNSLATSMT